MQPDLHSRALAAHTLHQFRTLSPLTHCMTNEVVQSFTANTLLALGASPAMVIEPEEASQFAAIASALLVNVGTLTQERATAMRAAVERAYHAKTPWTLDPVAVGALEFRRRFCLDLLSLQPAAIRGNASEILALAGMNGGDAAWIQPIQLSLRFRQRRRWLVRLGLLSWLPAKWITSPMVSVPLAWTAATR